MKRFVSCICILCLILSFARLPVSAVATDIAEVAGTTADGLEYEINDGEVAITGYTGDATEIVIPSVIESYPVTNIGEHAFAFPVTSITSITIPKGVTSIGDGAFAACDRLTSISLPDGVTSIGNDAFASCHSLTSITFPESVASIGNEVFWSCYSLTSVIMHDGVTSIGDSMFYCCASLTSITIPDSVTSIGDSAFYNCDSLTSITIPDNVTSIGKYVFYDCNSLRNITIPDNVTSIGTSAFEGCTRLISITIPDSVTSIGFCAFSSCSSLTSITIPQGVTSIGSAAFRFCSSLTGIVVDENNIVYDSRNNCNAIIETDTNTLIAVCVNSLIPDSVTSIGASAFEGCLSLTSIVIPDNITSVGEWAFAYCSRLTSITIPSTVSSIGSDAFYNCNSLTDVYYCGNEKQWYEFEIGEHNDSLLSAEIHYNYVVSTEPVFPKDYVTDEQTNISVATDTDAELVVSEITSKEDIADINFILVGERVNKMFDITLQKDGAEIQPDGKVWVRIPAENPDFKVYRMEEYGTLADMGAVYEDGFLSFATEHFSIYIVSEPESDSGLLGDANTDGDVNIKDATAIQKHIACIALLSEDGYALADYNTDSTVNIKDATAIQKYIAGII